MQLAPRRDAGIELAQGAGGGVAGIGEHRFAFLFARLVELKKLVVTHIDFAANLENLRRAPARNCSRDVVNGLQVLGDVFAGDPVAAGGPHIEPPVLVPQRNGQAVDLGLGDDVDGGIGFEIEKAPDAVEKIADVGFVERVVEGEHGHRMGDLREPFRGRGADA